MIEVRSPTVERYVYEYTQMLCSDQCHYVFLFAVCEINTKKKLKQMENLAKPSTLASPWGISGGYGRSLGC